MFKLSNMSCNACENVYEDLVEKGESSRCKQCGSTDTKPAPGIARPFETIQATTLTSKRFKAGYVHQFNRPKEKISVAVP